jgi:transposase
MVCDGSKEPVRRRHWPEAEKRRMVAEVGVDGRSLSDVARRHGVHPTVLGRWRARYGERADVPISATPTFVPVTVAAPVAMPEPPLKAEDGGRARVIEVILSNGRRLIVADGIAPARLRVLIAAVESA